MTDNINRNTPQRSERLNIELDLSGPPEKIMNEIQAILEINGQGEYRRKIRDGLAEDYPCHGVHASVIHAVSRSVGNICQSSEDKALTLFKSLWNTGSREERLIVASALACFYRNGEDKALRLILGFLPDIHSREICEAMAVNAMKPLAMKRREHFLLLIKSWLKSPNAWIRAFGVYCLMPLDYQGADDDLDMFLTILAGALRDDNREVITAVIKVMKKIVYKDPQRMFDFLCLLLARGGEFSETVVREVSKKMDQEFRRKLSDRLS